MNRMGASVSTDTPEMARYTCGFRTALKPDELAAHARSLNDIEWTVDTQATGLRLLGWHANRIQLEIWSDAGGTTRRDPTPDSRYGLSLAAPNPAEGADAFFTWRARIFAAFNAKLAVTSVEEEIRATHDAQRDILELDGQDLTELPRDIGTLQWDLKVLSLSGNRLSKLPDELFLLEQLTELDLSNNSLTELPALLGRLTGLTSLSVEHNRLRGLPPSIGQLTNLRELRVNDNKLRRLPVAIGQLTKLRQLHIQQNRLTQLPPEFSRLALWEWEVKQNRLPPSARDGLKAGQNPWIHPPEEIVKRGPKAIKEFLESHPHTVAEGPEAAHTVYVDDNHHQYEEEWKRRSVASFPDCGAAVAYCKKVVDDFFATFPAAPIRGLRGTDAEDLMQVYQRYGEDPWICSNDSDCVFDAWSYAERRCAEIAQTTRDNPPAPYTVFSCHNKDGSGRIKIGEFAECAPAIAACKKIVDDFLLEHNTGTVEQMFMFYKRFGQYVSVATRDEACVFVPWKYAEERCYEIVAERGV